MPTPRLQRSSRFLVAVTAVVLSIAACGGTSPSSGGTVTIGLPLGLSGSLASSGQDNLKGAQLAVQEINASGGLLGKQVALSPQDDACDSQTAIQAAQKLLTLHVVAAVGGSCSSAVLPASAAFHTGGDIPYVAISASNPLVTERGFDNIFRLQVRDDQAGPTDASFLLNFRQAQRIAILNDQTVFSKYLADAVKAAIQSSTTGAKVVYFDAITPGQQDYTATLTKIGTNKPDFLYFSGYYPEAGLIAKQMKTLGVSYKLDLNSASFDPQLLKTAGAAADGVPMVIPPYIPFVPGAAAAAFQKEFNAKYGADPGPNTSYAYDGLKLLADAIKRANSFDAAAVNKALAASNYDGVTGTIAFNSKGDRQNLPLIAVAVANGGTQFARIAVLTNGTWVASS